MTDQRTYNSPLREQQAAMTRRQILDALVDLVSDDGVEELNIKDVARRAGVSERTVYRHFSDREALRDGLFDELDARIDWPSTREFATLSEVVEAIPTTYRSFDENERDVRALVLMNLDPARTAAESRRHIDDIHAMVTAEHRHLDGDEVAGVAALVNLLASSRTWLRFLDAHGLTGERSARFAAWTLDLIRRELDAGHHVPELDPPEK